MGATVDIARYRKKRNPVKLVSRKLFFVIKHFSCDNPLNPIHKKRKRNIKSFLMCFLIIPFLYLFIRKECDNKTFSFGIGTTKRMMFPCLFDGFLLWKFFYRHFERKIQSFGRFCVRPFFSASLYTIYLLI